MKSAVESGPVPPIQQRWLDSILARVPNKLKVTKSQKEIIDTSVSEVKDEYYRSMKKSMGEFVCVQPQNVIIKR